MRFIIPAAILGVCLIIAVWIIGSAYRYKASAMETIVVTGLAEKDFNSDLIVWNGSYSRKSIDLKAAYALLKSDENSIRNYLISKGVAASEMVFSAVEINKEFNYRQDANGRSMGQEFSGYSLRQTVKVESNN